MPAFYNENDPYCAEWLRNLIAAKLIAPGTVDERDIRDIAPNELTAYTQCHFFAGIGGWSRALRLAAVPDHRPLWTGSCPCQPFSQAGKRRGFADERHLWPHWFRLIKACRPQIIFGEQVAAAKDWLYKVKHDLEHAGMSDVGREALYYLQTSKIFEGLPYLSRPWKERAQTAVQSMPASIRDEVAQLIEGLSQAAARETSGKGQDISAEVDSAEPSGVFDRRMSQAMCEEGDTVRSTFMDGGDRRENQAWGLRGDGISAPSCSGQRAQTEQCVVGSNSFEQRIFIRQHSGGVFGVQHGDKRLGGASGETDFQGMAGKVNDKRRTSSEAGAESPQDVARKRFVRGNLEALGYAVGAIPIEAASAGADQLRDRFWFVAHRDGSRNGDGLRVRLEQRPGFSDSARSDGSESDAGRNGNVGSSSSSRLAFGSQPEIFGGNVRHQGATVGPTGDRSFDMGDGASIAERKPDHEGNPFSTGGQARPISGGTGDQFEWAIGADGKARRVKPGICLLANDVPARVAKLRAFGNAVVPTCAAAFIKAALDIGNA